MAFGFPAYHKERNNLKHDVFISKENAIKTLLKMDCQEIGLHPFAIDYKTRGTMLTSGERIYVNITETEIIIRSECLFFTQCFDFGKNKSNIQQFWEIFDSL